MGTPEAIRFNCPKCSRKFSVDESKAGKKSACPACGARFRIPLPNQKSALPRTTPAVEAQSHDFEDSIENWMGGGSSVPTPPPAAAIRPTERELAEERSARRDVRHRYRSRLRADKEGRIKCPDCGKRIAADAARCPSCRGEPMKEFTTGETLIEIGLSMLGEPMHPKVTSDKILPFTILVMVGALVWFFFFAFRQ